MLLIKKNPICILLGCRKLFQIRSAQRSSVNIRGGGVILRLSCTEQLQMGKSTPQKPALRHPWFLQSGTNSDTSLLKQYSHLTDLFPEDWGTGLDCPPPPVPSNGLKFDGSLYENIHVIQKLSIDTPCTQPNCVYIPFGKFWRQLREKGRWSGGVERWRILRRCRHSGGVRIPCSVPCHSGMKGRSFRYIPWKRLRIRRRSTTRWR